MSSDSVVDIIHQGHAQLGLRVVLCDEDGAGEVPELVVEDALDHGARVRGGVGRDEGDLLDGDALAGGVVAAGEDDAGDGGHGERRDGAQGAPEPEVVQVEAHGARVGVRHGDGRARVAQVHDDAVPERVGRRPGDDALDHLTVEAGSQLDISWVSASALVTFKETLRDLG